LTNHKNKEDNKQNGLSAKERFLDAYKQCIKDVNVPREEYEKLKSLV
jgi:hypothetical protein